MDWGLLLGHSNSTATIQIYGKNLKVGPQMYTKVTGILSELCMASLEWFRCFSQKCKAFVPLYRWFFCCHLNIYGKRNTSNCIFILTVESLNGGCDLSRLEQFCLSLDAYGIEASFILSVRRRDLSLRVHSVAKGAMPHVKGCHLNHDIRPKKRCWTS